eukprot:scaffold7972_cov565-Prasinococcus_capsulatus_cf.AAC.2
MRNRVAPRCTRPTAALRSVRTHTRLLLLLRRRRRGASVVAAVVTRWPGHRCGWRWLRALGACVAPPAGRAWAARQWPRSPSPQAAPSWRAAPSRCSCPAVHDTAARGERSKRASSSPGGVTYDAGAPADALQALDGGGGHRVGLGPVEAAACEVTLLPAPHDLAGGLVLEEAAVGVVDDGRLVHAAVCGGLRDERGCPLRRDGGAGAGAGAGGVIGQVQVHAVLHAAVLVLEAHPQAGEREGEHLAHPAELALHGLVLHELFGGGLPHGHHRGQVLPLHQAGRRPRAQAPGVPGLLERLAAHARQIRQQHVLPLPLVDVHVAELVHQRQLHAPRVVRRGQRDGLEEDVVRLPQQDHLLPHRPGAVEPLPHRVGPVRHSVLAPPVTLWLQRLRPEGGHLPRQLVQRRAVQDPCKVRQVAGRVALPHVLLQRVPHYASLEVLQRQRAQGRRPVSQAHTGRTHESWPGHAAEVAHHIGRAGGSDSHMDAWALPAGNDDCALLLKLVGEPLTLASSAKPAKPTVAASTKLNSSSKQKLQQRMVPTPGERPHPTGLCVPRSTAAAARLPPARASAWCGAERGWRR